MKTELSKAVVKAIVDGNHGDPCSILGPQKTDEGLTIRTLQLFANEVMVVENATGEVYPMKKTHKSGLFEVTFPDREYFAYRLRMIGDDGHEWELEDPYRFPSSISDFDMYLFGEGTAYKTYEKMGAHAATVDGVEGVQFAVWAPNAKRVSIIGWFNRWDGRHNPMQPRGGGLWEIFMPSLATGDLYKFEIKGQDGYLIQKADPYAFATELRPQTASVVHDVNGYDWNDTEWIKRREQGDALNQPLSVYEVHLGSWRRVPAEENRWLTYREMADELIPYVKELGFTHIELLPITEHPFDGSWGYQAISYFAPTSRFGSPDDLKYFIDRCHQEDIGVILDWVPAHFPKDGHGLGYFDGTHLYEHADPRKGEHTDWGTLIFNYGRNEVRTFLLSSAIFWAEIYHVDGIRVDAVASMLYLDYSREAGEWIPNEFGGRENLEAVDFLKQFNDLIHEQFPGFTTFAEESTAWPMVSRPTYLGGLGFDFKWNMGWMNDTLDYIEKEPIHRKFHHNTITFSLLYAFTENFILPFSHDEVVHGKRSLLDKMPGDVWQKFANLRLLYAYMYAHPGKKLLFMGCEFGQWNEWDSMESLDWNLLDYEPHRQLKYCLQNLNGCYKDNAAMYQKDFSWEGFEWIDPHDNQQSILSFIRRGNDPDDLMICVYNFTPVPREGYRLGVPLRGAYDEIFNSDAECYGGSNVGNAGLVPADPIPWQGQDYSMLLTLPPLGALYFRPANVDE